MGDTLNSLLQANRSSSVLQGIANPAQVNPLAALNSGQQAAANTFNLRKLQADQAAGQAYQGAINQDTGEFDPNKFRTLLAQSGPAAMAAGAALLNTQSISSDQLNQNMKKLDWYNAAAGSLMDKGNDVTHADVMGVLQRGMASGALTLPEAQRAMASVPTNQAELPGWVRQHALTAADASTRFNQTVGTRQTTTAGGTTYNYTAPPPGGPTVQIQHGPDPGAVQAASLPVRADGSIIQRNPDGSLPEVPHHYEPADQPKVGNPSFQQATPPQVVPGSGGGGGGPGQAPPVTPGGGTPLPGQIYRDPRLGNQIAPNFDPVTGKPLTYSATPPPMPPGARPDSPSTHRALPPPAQQQPPAQQPPAQQQPPAAPVIRTAPPQGQPASLEANQAEYRADQAAIPSTMTRAQNMGKAYQALSLLKEMNSTTGVGAAGWQAFRSRMGTLGLLPDSSMSVQQQQEEFAKYTEKLMLDAAGGSSTNLGKQMAEKSNPGNILGMGANFDVLRSDLGKTLQTAAAQLSHEDKTGGGYLDHRSDIATKTDPRGFVWNTYDQNEQAKIMAEAEAQRDGGEAVRRLKRAIGLSSQFNLSVPGATKPPPVGKQSLLMPPPAPQQNALTMAG